jgi:hypothetical protein
MPSLLSIPVTTAQAAQLGAVFEFVAGDPRNLCVQGNFTYGSGGTSADAWVQTSVDGGTTWTDVCNFHFTTASARFLFNLSSLTPVTTEYTPTDGTLAANTAKDGIVGSRLRVKYTTVGTYAGGTALAVDVATARMVSP